MDAQIAALSAIRKLQTVKLPYWPPHDKVKELVLAVRTSKAGNRAAGAEKQIFVDWFTLHMKRQTARAVDTAEGL